MSDTSFNRPALPAESEPLLPEAEAAQLRRSRLWWIGAVAVDIAGGVGASLSGVGPEHAFLGSSLVGIFLAREIVKINDRLDALGPQEVAPPTLDQE